MLRPLHLRCECYSALLAHLKRARRRFVECWMGRLLVSRGIRLESAVSGLTGLFYALCP